MGIGKIEGENCLFVVAILARFWDLCISRWEGIDRTGIIEYINLDICIRASNYPLSHHKDGRFPYWHPTEKDTKDSFLPLGINTLTNRIFLLSITKATDLLLEVLRILLKSYNTLEFSGIISPIIPPTLCINIKNNVNARSLA